MNTTFMGFVRRVMSFIKDWDGRHTPTRAELERMAQWWNESHDCCPEAVAMDIRFIYPAPDTMRAMVRIPPTK